MKKQLRILALGNSFSQDCTAYLDRMTDAGLLVRNLYIGGCSLERHAGNLRTNAAEYEYQKDGVAIGGGHVSANEILSSEPWDFVTVQQSSGLSGCYESYVPYLEEVLSYIRTLCPTAQPVWNETWAYATTSTHAAFQTYEYSQQKMIACIRETARRVCGEFGIDRMIRTGDAIQLLRENVAPDGTEFCRDGFHLSLNYGRYAAAYVWARFFGLPVNGFVPDGADPERILACVSVLKDAGI